MIPATIQQLSVVERKATKLEQQVASNIETLKAAKTERDDAEARVLELRRLLEEETLRAEKAHVVHEKAESMLRHSAGEYRKAQLLQKKLLNTLKELQGFNRAVVLVEGGGGAALFSQPVMNNDANAAEMPPSSTGALRVADNCTIHIPSMRKTIVVDSIVSPPTMQDHHQSSLDHNLSMQDDTKSSSTSALLIPSLVGEALGGYNISITVIGPKGAGKSASTWGVMREENGAGMHRGNRSFNISPQNSANKNAISDPSGFLLAKYFRGFDSYFGHQTNKPSAEGPSKGSSTAPPALVPLFMHHLFTHFATYDVTHFNIRITFVELVADGTVDLFVVPGHSLGILPESATMPIGISGDADREHDANGNAHPSSALYMASQRAVSMQVRTEEEFYEALRHAFANRAHRLSAKHRAASDEAIRSNSRRTSGVASQGGVAHPATSLAPHKLADLYGGHLALSVHIENFNARGNFRRSTVLFTDVAGGLTLDKSSAEVGHAERSRSGSSAIERSQQQQTTDQIWAAKGAWALTDVISMASAAAATSVSQSNNSTVNASRTTATTMTAPYVTNAAQAALANLELPHKANRLVQLVREGFGGNAKGVLYCVVPPCSSFPDPEGLRLSNQNAEPSETSGDIMVTSLNALAYAHYFKGTCHNAIPLDVPPELQQLTREVGGDDGDYYDEGEPDNWANNEEDAYRSSHQNDHGLQTSLTAGVRGGPPLGRV